MATRANDIETLPLPITQTAKGSSAWDRTKRYLQRAVVYLVLIVVSILMIAPFYFLVSGSLMDRGEMFKVPPSLWPATPIWANFKTIFTDYNFGIYLRNSAIVSLAQTIGVLFFASLAGFIFAKRQFPGRDWLFVFVLITAAMPKIGRGPV